MAATLAQRASCSRPNVLVRPARSTAFTSRVGVQSINRRVNFVVRAENQQAVKTVLEVNDDTWTELVDKSDVPVMVDFWAPWCGPCRMIAPLIDELAEEYKGKAKFMKLNTDQSPNTATTFGIRSIPTVMIFKGGKRMESVIGAVPKGTLKTALDKYLAN